MQELLDVQGIVIKVESVDEYDKKVTLITREKGKIIAYAKGARRTGNKLQAPCDVFNFGSFKLFAYRNSYQLTDASIRNFFPGLRADYEASFYGSYFLEIASFYARENTDETEMIKLLYCALEALLKDQFPRTLVRSVYEIKAIMINGEFMGIPENSENMSTIDKVIRYIYDNPSDKIYNFVLNEDLEQKLKKIAKDNTSRAFDRPFMSLQLIEND